jgi:hypothetical protein
MNWEAIGAIAEVIGVVAVIATVVYLSMQIKQSNRQQSAEAVKNAVKEFVDTYAAVTSDEKAAENFIEGLNRFGDLDRTTRAVFQSKMQLLTNGYYQVWTLYKSGMLLDEPLYRKSECLYLSFVLAPGGRQWWESMKHLPPETLAIHIDGRLNEPNLGVTPANEDLDWFRGE